MSNQFIENMEQKLNDFSLDDLERLSEALWIHRPRLSENVYKILCSREPSKIFIK